jgi:diacylglycerol kinase family enzyme
MLQLSCHTAACRYDTLVAGGGDGTLNELVAALLKHDAPCHISVAQLPLGTANDLASAAGISLVSSSSSSSSSDMLHNPADHIVLEI